MTTWLHTHLPRLQSGVPECVSAKIPGQRVEYVSWAMLVNAEFRVSEAGRRRCLETGVRNVHAWVVGEEVGRGCDVPVWSLSDDWRTALYDPWRGGAFVDAETLEPVFSARRVIVIGKSVRYLV